MKKLIFFISMLFLFSCSSDKQVKIATFNVRYHSPNDGKNIWPNRVPVIQTFLNKESFDIIGMQEVTHPQLLDLKKILPDYDYAGTGREDGREKGEFCPIFYKKSKYTLMAKSQFWLSETPDIPGSISWGGTYPRIVTWVKLVNNKTGHIFYVFNTHFCHMSELARENSANLIIKNILEIADAAPVVLTGDFNTTKDSKPYQILSQNWDRFLSLSDSEELASKFENKDSTTFNGFNVANPIEKIDFVFTNSYFSIRNYKIHLIREGDVFISDHYPVSATLNFLFEKRARQGPLIRNSK